MNDNTEMAAHIAAILAAAPNYAADNRRDMQRWTSLACPKSFASAIEADAVALYGHVRKYIAWFKTPAAAASYAAGVIADKRADRYTVPATMSAARGAVRRAAMAACVDALAMSVATNKFAVCMTGEHRACYR